MIKHFSVSTTKAIRDQLEEWVLIRPALMYVYKFVGALAMLPVNPASPPTRFEKINSYFQYSHENFNWIMAQTRRASRMRVFIAHERIDCIKVESRWYVAGVKDPIAELIVLFDDENVVRISQTQTSTD